jgi:hypothetical protein
LSEPALPTAPFFILGTHGSGSTLLRLMLDSHPRLAVPPETGVMRLVTAHRWTPWWELGGTWHDSLDLTDDDVDVALRAHLSAWFERYAERRGKVRWGEKTPFHVWHVDDIVRVFPDARLVVIVRHPLGSIGSMVRRFDRKLGKAVKHWTRAVQELTYQASRHGDRMCVVRYEDLIREPGQTMRELLDWLGEPWSDDVLRHHEQHQQGPKVVEGGTRPRDALDADRIDRWREWFDDAERRSIVDATSSWASLLGYGEDPSVPAAHLAGDGRTQLFTGEELAARADGQAELDRTPPRPPRADRPILPRGRRRRARALRRAQGTSQATRQLFERLPPKMQRRIRDSRRARRRS